MIEISHLVKYYGDKKAVDDLSFSIQEGEIVGFLGPNGAGKSTTMNILTGYLSATSGSVRVHGHDILENPREAKKQIGYLPETPPLYLDMTVSEYLHFVAGLKALPRVQHRAAIERVMETVKITQVAGRLIRNLSKGYRQRVGLAQALLGNAEVLILDEPTVGLDPKQIIEIRDMIRELGKKHTVILSSHILSEVQAVCERVLIIHQGKLVLDRPIQSLSEGLHRELLFDVQVEGPEKAVIGKIRHITGVCGCEILQKPRDGQLLLRLKTKTDFDVRALFFALAEERWPMLALHPKDQSLEEIFIKLTSGSPALHEPNGAEA